MICDSSNKFLPNNNTSFSSLWLFSTLLQRNVQPISDVNIIPFQERGSWGTFEVSMYERLSEKLRIPIFTDNLRFCWAIEYTSSGCWYKFENCWFIIENQKLKLCIGFDRKNQKLKLFIGFHTIKSKIEIVSWFR